MQFIWLPAECDYVILVNKSCGIRHFQNDLFCRAWLLFWSRSASLAVEYINAVPGREQCCDLMHNDKWQCRFPSVSATVLARRITHPSQQKHTCGVYFFLMPSLILVFTDAPKTDFGTQGYWTSGYILGNDLTSAQMPLGIIQGF